MSPGVEASRFARLRALSAADRRLRIAAWFALAAAALRLRVAPRRALARALAPPPAAPGRTTDRAEAERVARAVASAAAHHLRPLGCLPRSLALWKLLEARGLAPRLRIGVRKEGGALAAHAWVEVDGAALGEPEAIESRFLPLVEAAPGAR